MALDDPVSGDRTEPSWSVAGTTPPRATETGLWPTTGTGPGSLPMPPQPQPKESEMTRRRIMHQSAGLALVVAAAALIGPAAASAESSSTNPSTGNTAHALALSTSLAGPSASPAPDVDTGGDVASPPDPDPVFPAVSADTAIVIDRRSGAVLGAKQADLLWAPASTTKMMTALLTIEAVNAGQVSLDDQVQMQADVRIEAWGGGIGLEPGDIVKLRDLLYMTLVESGGDAATAIGDLRGREPSRLRGDDEHARSGARTRRHPLRRHQRPRSGGPQ